MYLHILLAKSSIPRENVVPSRITGIPLFSRFTGSPTAGGADNEDSGSCDGCARKEDDDDGCESDGSSCCSGSSLSDDSGDDMSVCGPVGPASDDDDDEALMVALAKSLADGGGGGDAKKKKKKKSKDSSKWASKTDKLDLAGLLNVLDGVVDTPNRIVIMTTNHPEVTVGVQGSTTRPKKTTRTRASISGLSINA